MIAQDLHLCHRRNCTRYHCLPPPVLPIVTVRGKHCDPVFKSPHPLHNFHLTVTVVTATIHGLPLLLVLPIVTVRGTHLWSQLERTIVTFNIDFHLEDVFRSNCTRETL
jgi:hypothetical protein